MKSAILSKMIRALVLIMPMRIADSKPKAVEREIENIEIENIQIDQLKNRLENMRTAQLLYYMEARFR